MALDDLGNVVAEIEIKVRRPDEPEYDPAEDWEPDEDIARGR